MLMKCVGAIGAVLGGLVPLGLPIAAAGQAAPTYTNLVLYGGGGAALANGGDGGTAGVAGIQLANSRGHLEVTVLNGSLLAAWNRDEIGGFFRVDTGLNYLSGRGGYAGALVGRSPEGTYVGARAGVVRALQNGAVRFEARVDHFPGDPAWTVVLLTAGLQVPKLPGTPDR